MDYMSEIASYLVASSLGQIGVDLAVNAQPDRMAATPSTGPETFLLAEQGGEPVYVYESSTPAIRVPRLRVNVRSTEPAAETIPASSNAFNRASDVHDALSRVVNRTLSSTLSGSTGWYLHARPDHEPFLSGRDARGRTVFTFTATIERQDR